MTALTNFVAGGGGLIADAMRWVLDSALPLQVDAPPTLQISLRRCNDGLAVHCVNLTAGERYMREIVPLHDCRIGVRLRKESDVQRARQVCTGCVLSVERDNGWAWVTVPLLGAYDVILFETSLEEESARSRDEIAVRRRRTPRLHCD